MKNNLTGKWFLADLGAFKAELFFESDVSLVFKIVEAADPENQDIPKKYRSRWLR